MLNVLYLKVETIEVIGLGSEVIQEKLGRMVWDGIVYLFLNCFNNAQYCGVKRTSNIFEFGICGQ